MAENYQSIYEGERMDELWTLAGTAVQKVKVNGQTISPVNGLLTLPDYPTELTWNAITGKPSWIGANKPTYTLAELTADSTHQTVTAAQKAILDLFEYDSETHTLIVKKDNEIDVNFAAYGEVSAGGIGQGGGGGATYLYMLEDVPDYRTAYRGKYLRAKADGSGTEWVDVTGGVSSVISLTGDITQSQLRTALGLGSAAYTDSSAYATATQGSHADTAYGWGNHASAGYLTGITSSMVTTALGYTPYNAANISSASVAYATSAGNADTLDGQHGSYFQPASTAINTGNIASQSVAYAATAGSTTLLHFKGRSLNNPTPYGISYDSQIPRTSEGIFPGGGYHNAVINIDRYLDGSNNFVTQLGFSSSGIYCRIFTGSTPDTTTAWNTLYHSGNSNNTSTPWSCSNLTASGNIYSTSDLCINKSSYSTVGPYSSGLGAALTVKANGGNAVSVGIGTGGTNHGLWSEATSSWIVYMDNSNVNVPHNLVATGEVTAGASSDSRFKDNQISLRNADEILKSLRPMEFDWNELYHSLGGRNEGHDVGFIAQQVQPLIPSAIGKVYGDYLRLDYNKVTPYLVAGWQSHETRIQQLERENAELKRQLQTLKS